MKIRGHPTAIGVDPSGPVRGVLAAFSASILTVCGACGHAPTAPVPPTPPPVLANTAPTVTVAFQGSSACVPLPGKPCTLTVKADASDPDQDPLSFVWSGCATGTSNQATCTIDQLGPVAATVDVSDGHGHTVRGSASGNGGTNQPPGVQIGYITPIGDVTVELLGNIVDPDEGFLCGTQYCESATAAGACKPNVFLRCSCLAGLEADAYRTASSGTCTVTFNVKDSWGLVGTTSVTFTYPR